LTDNGGIPLSVAVSAANTHDSHALTPLVTAIPGSSPTGDHTAGNQRNSTPTKPMTNPLRDWVAEHGIAVRIARKAVETSQTLGKHRWIIERSIAWLFDYRHLTIRYERHANHFCAFLTLAAILTCFKKLTK
jgi:hypothetical protein